ncbi:MAG TPA: hypothetical protein VFG10_05010 [Saprospiraceae bacterium]|nr:hypothetical protein [Saprospiraceae bacterium]
MEELLTYNLNDPRTGKRQEYFDLGRTHENKLDFISAIDAYKLYLTFLNESDQHIPQQWISILYEKLGNKADSLIHLALFADGCSKPFGAEIFREIGEEYEKIDFFNDALHSYNKSIALNPKIGLKMKILSLQKK